MRQGLRQVFTRRYYLAAGLALLLLALYAVIWSTAPVLDEVGSNVQARWQAQSEARRGKSGIQVTREPFGLFDYLSDIRIGTETPTELRSLISGAAWTIPDILRDSTLQLQLGERGRRYRLTLRWNVGNPDGSLTLRLYDRYERPLDHASGAAGELVIDSVEGGPVQIALDNVGLFGDGFTLTATLAPSGGRGSAAKIAEIPVVSIRMDAVSFKNWDQMRRESLGEVIAYKANGAEATLRDNRVKARLFIDGSASAATISLVGMGDPIHLSRGTPSFKVRIKGGPLMRSMSAFKLTSLETNTLLLDLAVNSLLHSEGILKPRMMMVNLRFNNRNLRLYTLEEVQQNRGFFEGMKRYDGLFVSTFAERIFLDTKGAWAAKQTLTFADLVSSEFTRTVNRKMYAKTLAFMSRFHAGHGLLAPDHRVYRSILLGGAEPWVKDLNVGRWRGPEITRELFSHANWWLRYPVTGVGGVVHPKTFPNSPPFPKNHLEFAQGPASVRYQNFSPIVSNFLRWPENRQAFEKFILYATDNVFQRRFMIRLKGLLEVATPYLTQKITNPRFKKDQEYSKEAAQQASFYGQNPMPVPHAVSQMLRHSALLIDVVPTPHPMQGASSRRLVVYNLSAFSGRLRLPDYVRVVSAHSVGGPEKALKQGYFLAPSQFFLAVTPVFNHRFIHNRPIDFERTNDDLPAPQPLSQDAARRLIAFERLQFRSQPDMAPLPAPFIEVEIPEGHFEAFLDFAKRTSLLSIAGDMPLPRQRNLFVGDLGEDQRDALHALFDYDRSDKASVQNVKDGASLPILAIERDAPFGMPGHFVRFDGVRSSVTVMPDMAGEKSFGISAWLKPDMEQRAKSVTVINTGNGKNPACILYLDTAANDHGMTLNWQCMGAIVQTAIKPAWTKIEFGVSETGGEIWLRAGENQTKTAKLNAARHTLLTQVTIGGASTGKESFFAGFIADIQIRPQRAPGERRSRDKPASPNIADPDIVILPLSIQAQGNIRRLNFLIANVSDRDRLIHLDRLIWKTYPGIVMRKENQRILSTRIRNVWALGPTPRRVRDTQITLGGSAPLVMATGLHRPSPLFWPGGLHQLLRPSINANPNAILIDVDFGEVGPAWTDASGLVVDGRSADAQPLVAVLEPRQFRIPRPQAVNSSKAAPYIYDESHKKERFERSLTALGFQLTHGAGKDERIIRPRSNALRVDAPLHIPAGYVLELPAGTTVRFGKEGGIFSRSPVRVLGRADAPVRLIPAEGVADWIGLAIVGTGRESVLSHLQMRRTRGGFLGRHQISGGLSVYNSRVRIEGMVTRDLASNDGIHLSHSLFAIRRLDMDGTASDALDIDWSFGKVSDSDFRNCGSGDGGDCVDLSASRGRLANLRIAHATDKGVSIGEGSVVDATGLTVADVKIGIAVKDGAIARLSECQVTNASFGLLRYIKKPYYGYPEIGSDCATTNVNIPRHDESPLRWTNEYN